MDADEDKIGGMLRRSYKTCARQGRQSELPREETLAVFRSGDLPKEARNEVEAHLAQCSFCSVGSGCRLQIRRAYERRAGPATAYRQCGGACSWAGTPI